MSSERRVSREVPPRDEPFLYIPTDGEGGGTLQSVAGPVAWNAQSGAAKAAADQRERDAFERGVKDGEIRTGAAAQQEGVATRAAISVAVEKFKADREAYFKRVEPEVVQLALAISRKILHREAQMDPLLLEGMVHVALEKIGAGTRVRLCAHPADIQLWGEHFSKSGTTQVSPELVGNPGLKRGECTLETEVGSTQISLEAQLKEIEQGFFDLLDQRPPVP